MKNKTLTFAAFLLTGTLLFAGCGQASSANANTSVDSATGTTVTKSGTTESASTPADKNTFTDDGVFSNLNTTDFDGNTIDASTFKDNRLTLVNAWNIGCTPCVNELPALEQISQEYAGKGVSIKGLYFNYAEDISDDEMSQIRDVLNTAKATYPQLHLTKEMYASDTLHDIMAFPTTYILDSNGNIIDKLEGSKDYDEWKEVIEKYLAQVQ